jgi:hypothetical protein
VEQLYRTAGQPYPDQRESLERSAETFAALFHDDDEPSERANRSKRVEWVERRRDVIADEPELPGGWRRQGGGHRVRGRTIDPRSGKMREINWALPNLSKVRDALES